MPYRRFWPVLALLAGTLSLGTFGFPLLEGWSVGESAYSTVLIVSTLGFATDQPATPAGKLLTVLLIGGGVGTLYYLLGVLAQGLIENELGARRRRRLKRQMEALRDHVIVCGYGRVGRELISELRRESQSFVLVDTDLAKVERLQDEGVVALAGDAARDEVLRAAGIERARGLVVCTGSDAVNVFITLSARSLREDLLIVARAIHEDDEPKLLRAGATRAITPASLGGRRIAGLLLRPTVVELLDVLARSGNLGIYLEQVRLAAGSQLVGRSLGQARLREGVGANVLAIKRVDGALITNPAAETPLHGGDTLVVLGASDALARLEALAG